MLHIAICGLSGCTIFSTLSHKGHNFRKKNSLNIKCVVLFYLQILSERFCIIRRTERVTVNTVCRSSCEVPLLWGDINETWIFSKYFLKIFQYHIAFKFFQWETSSVMWTDRRTDRHEEADSGFAEFCKRAKQWRTTFFVRPTGLTATGPVSPRLRLAHSHLNYAVPFFLLFDQLGSVLRVPSLRPRSAPAMC